ncbi:MAG: DNA-formamidopyrimidine glycosylase [Halobacteriovoraceae bacterium]|nr:DNA-formamidopyrimidine glycosylase [Halobacteriovoraceae bacterium]
MPFTIESRTLSDVAGSIVHTKMDKLGGKTILAVNRKGKMLDFLLDDGRHLLSHLGMTGTWLISKEKIKEKHTHVQIKGDRGYLAYVDPRRFGHMYLYDEESAQKKLNELGMDLLDKKFTLEYFSQALKKYPERFIKVTLLDQKLFAGTGNYIANEICAHGRVLPNRTVKSLSSNEIENLYAGVFKVLNPTINSGGTTFAGGYRDTSGDKGQGVNHLVVFYQKLCQLCQKTKVEKIVLGQRGTYYCPHCQK